LTRFLSLDDFKTRIGLDELAQIAGIGSFNDPAGRTLDLPRIEEAIAFSEDLLIGYARSRYARIETLTPEATPDLVKGLISDIARYRLRSRSGGQGQVSAEVLKRHEDALAFIRSVATGKAELPIAGEPPNGEAGGARVDAMIPPSPVAGMLQGWRQ
jgi:phage gp36-like protein